jgi:hypothetical protein
MRLGAVAATVGVAALVAGCGSSGKSRSSTEIKDVQAKPTTSATAGARTFSAPGMAVHFDYPKDLKPLALQKSKRVTGANAQTTHAAVGVAGHDLIVVTRFPHRPIPVTAKNIKQLQQAFDTPIGSLFGRPVTSTVATIGGLPVLVYPPLPVQGLGEPATSNVLLAFVADDEYEINCQATAAGKAAIGRACAEMRATLHAN